MGENKGAQIGEGLAHSEFEVVQPHKENKGAQNGEGSANSEFDVVHPIEATTCPMRAYEGQRWGATACFCHKAQNLGCLVNDQCPCREGCDEEITNISVASESVTFPSFPTVWGCRSKGRILTIPKSYFKNINDLKVRCGEKGMRKLLTEMLVAGYNGYQNTYGKGPVVQCIHRPWAVTVQWMHLHTFCSTGRADGMPNPGRAFCLRMDKVEDGEGIARRITEFIEAPSV